MKIEKTVYLGHQDISVDICVEDISSALDDAPDSKNAALVLINSVAKCLKGIRDDHIAEMNEPQRSLISKFLLEQSARFEPKP